MSNPRPCKAVVIAEQPVSAEQRTTVCHWLIDSGCLFVMSWGDDCAAWAANVASLNRAAHAADEIPDERLVITTTHEDETLEQVFWFAKYTAMHPCADLEHVLLIHLATENCEREFLEALQQA